MLGYESLFVSCFEYCWIVLTFPTKPRQKYCTNSLFTGSFFFYFERRSEERKKILCQFPYSGNFHFYYYREKMTVKTQLTCQFPYSGNFHFYKQTTFSLANAGCVNSRIRVTSISTRSTAKVLSACPHVSIPLFG